ncbi:glycosyltransferase family A protein [Fictibacillus nanhaiensis]|uniref:glycosyltransferase family A protein n=1 Tax=Fictibacillus nanhaiensis TaxID=742169 RepID=UPI003C1F1CE3
MIKNFYEIQCWFEKKNIFILRKVSYKLLILLIRVLVPLSYKVRPSRLIGIQKTKKNTEPRIIISLTTFPPRMKKLWMVIESLLRQTHKPNKIILWLAHSQFPTMNNIDKKILEMQKRGLEIRFCDDLLSHKKYFYAMQEYSNDIIVTVDDDIFYPEDMIETLLNKHQKYPDCVVCYRAHRITISKGRIKKYREWDYSSRNILGPDNLLMATGCGGVLYPPKSMNMEVFNIDAIKELCPNADDLWLKCMGFMNDTKTVKISKVFSEMFTTSGSNDSGLAKNNVLNGENDIQLRNIIKKYNIDFTNK